MKKTTRSFRQRCSRATFENAINGIAHYVAVSQEGALQAQISQPRCRQSADVWDSLQNSKAKIRFLGAGIARQR
jgi:hypothetical protein